jgi:phosphatidylinositol glycan class M
MATPRPGARSNSPLSQLRRSTPLLVLSLSIHLALLLYAEHVDANPQSYGGLKYTDVDWRVVVDGARQVVYGGREGRSEAAGWAAGWMRRRWGWKIGW